MVHVMIQHEVEDFDAWKPIFDDHARAREEHGSRGGMLYRSTENPDDITVIFEWDDRDNAQAFVESEDLREKMEEAGVVGEPQIRFLDGVEDIKA